MQTLAALGSWRKITFRAIVDIESLKITPCTAVYAGGQDRDGSWKVKPYEK